MRILALIFAATIGFGVLFSGIFVKPTILPEKVPTQFTTITEEDIPPLVATTTPKQPPPETRQEQAPSVQEKASATPETPSAAVSTTTDSSAGEEESTPPSYEQLNEQTRAATVNILCRVQTNEGQKVTTGSGVIIDPRGIVLTNAHVAYLLLYNSDAVSCQVRKGAPAEPLYIPQLLYISTSWVHENRDELSQENPKGTGEHDYALLIPTEPLEPQPFLPLGDPIELSPSLDVFLGAYPAGFLGSATVERDLYPATAATIIDDFYTFGDGEIDLASLGSTILAQRGSSGGAVVHAESGTLLGLIVTTTEGEATSQRNLHAVLLSHINRSMEEELGEDLINYISGNIWIRAGIFNRAIAPALQVFLEDK